MKRIYARLAVTVFALELLVPFVVDAQESPKADVANAPAPDDTIGQQAAALEAELGKYKDTAPEAADAMAKLIDLYYADGRLFGLVRVAQRFVSSHPTDSRHRAATLKLIDAQEALARGKDLGVSIRQFLARYPDAPEAAALELRLADAMLQLDDRKRTAEACWAVWTRRGPDPVGRVYGVHAVKALSALGAADTCVLAGQYCEEMVEKLPPGEFSREVGQFGAYEYRRAGQWAKSNAIGAKMLARGLPAEPAGKRLLHLQMAENYGNLGQHANSAESLKQARAIQDDQSTHYLQIYRMYHGAAKPAELEPIVNEYVAKYPNRQDRFDGLSALAAAYSNNNEKPRAVAIISQILADAPTNYGAASYFGRDNGVEPAQLADTEQKLLAAIAQNKPTAYYLRYVLALEHYRDRMKEPAKARAVLRDMLLNNPSNDGHSSGAVDWLLTAAESDAEFDQQLATIVESRKKYPHVNYIGDALKNWSNNAKQNKDLVDRANRAMDAWTQSSADPNVAAFAAQMNSQHHPGEAIREKLLAPETFNTLSEPAQRMALQLQADYYRHYSPGEKRPLQVKVWKQFAQRFPQELLLAWTWFETAVDYGKPEEQREAAQNWLRFPPESANADAWRRLLMVADRANDADFGRVAWNYMQQAQQKFGFESTYATTIGDMLVKLKMEDEAVQHWTKAVAHDRQSTESRDSAARLLARLKEPTDAPKRIALLEELLQHPCDFRGRYRQLLAHERFIANQGVEFENQVKAAAEEQAERPFKPSEIDPWLTMQWLDTIKTDAKLAAGARRRFLSIFRDFGVEPTATVARVMLDEAAPPAGRSKIDSLLELQRATRTAGDEWWAWDRMLPFAQGAAGKKDFMSSVVLSTGMLANIPNIDETRRKVARDLITQSLTRLGGVGLSIDDSSPLAPLMQAAMYFRLGDDRLAYETYLANKPLFDQNRAQLPPDLLMFVCERLMAAGTEADHEYVEETLRSWLVAWGENPQQDDATKARMQLTLGKNFFKAQRYDVARSEYTTVVNRFAGTPQATEAEFGIGETFLAQKVYDQAELVFERLARSHEIDVVVRAEFLRGVLAFRRGDRDEARDIFKSVLERVPNVELANQALFNLAEVYGAEERYIDQLNLLRTVGRLGRTSKRRHTPGAPLSIVVHDSDLGISRGHNRIPVKVTTVPGGDEETVYLVGSGAGKGLFRVDLETRLGQATPNDRVLQLTGRDSIKCDYPDAFKSEFKNVPLSDVEIKVAADAKFEIASSKIEDAKYETLTEQIAREKAAAADKRLSQGRPKNQIKPGNPVYIRVKDADRDLSDQADKLVVKLAADSGDQVQVALEETGPHTGVFEATAPTGDLPAGAMASDTAIDHGPLMAIDRDPKTYWMSEPDGAPGKWLSVDTKDLRSIARVRFTPPTVAKRSPVRADLQGSVDGQFWFRVGSYPERESVPSLVPEFGAMTRRVIDADFSGYTGWEQFLGYAKTAQPIDVATVESLEYTRDPKSDRAQYAYAVVWQGKFVQPKTGAVRIVVDAFRSALVVDGLLESPFGPGGRATDLWLEAGTHDLTILATAQNGTQRVEARLARANDRYQQVFPTPFRASDFDLTSDAAQRDASKRPEPLRIPLPLNTATLTKTTPEFAVHPYGADEAIHYWKANEDLVKWEVDVPAAGAYEIWLEFAHEGEGGAYRLEIDDQTLEAKIPNTGGWGTFQKHRAGAVVLGRAGRHTLTVKPLKIENTYLMILRSANIVKPAGAVTLIDTRGWEFHIPPRELRHVRLQCHEYLGDALAIANVEVAGPDGQLVIPTKEDVLALAANATLEIAGGDNVVATYTDEVSTNESAGSQLLTSRLQATYNNATILPIAYDFGKTSRGDVFTIRKDLKRVDPGERIIVEVVDYDEDRSNQRDTVAITASVNDGPPLPLEAIEIDNFRGEFTKEIDTLPLNPPTKPAAKGAKGKDAGKDAATETPAPAVKLESGPTPEGKLRVKPGDRVVLKYIDTHNTYPGHAAPREETILIPTPAKAAIRVLETRLAPTPAGYKGPVQTVVLPKRSVDVAGVAFEAPLTIEVIDPDAAKDSRSVAVVKLATTDGAIVEVECHVSSRFADYAGTLDAERMALEEGRFVGQVVLQLGGKNSPALVPVTGDMPRDLVGKVRLGEATKGDTAAANLITRVLNVSGKDVVTAEYVDERRPAGAPERIAAKGRLISNGRLAATDRDYDKLATTLHVGERLHLKVVDADLDASDARDFADVEVTTERGEKETVRLEETLAHSGEFTGSLHLKAAEQPTPNNLDVSNAAIETYFGDKLTVKFVDPAASTESGTLEQTVELPVVVGTDGLVAAFSKTFSDENLAVETKFRIAESYFELFKSHKQLGRDEERRVDLEAGRRVLREVIEDYPDPKHAPRIAYLLGQFSQELEQWNDAIASYDSILRQYPEHSLAPDAQYKLAQCYEQAGAFDEALEAYVTLAATHPKSPLIPNVMIRISDYFYKNEQFEVAAQVGEKFLERFESHANAPRLAFRIGQCWYKAKRFDVAGKAFDHFIEVFPKDALSADSLFWSGESYRMGGNNKKAFMAYLNCKDRYPESEAAKYARGRLALPEMLQQFEAEANEADQGN